MQIIVDLSFQSFFGRKDVEDISIYIIAHAKRNVYLCARRADRAAGGIVLPCGPSRKELGMENV